MAFVTYQFLRDHRDEIIREWETLVAAELRDAELAGSALRDHLPVLLDELARWLEQGDAPETARMRIAAGRHAAQSLTQACELARLIHELRLFRAVLLRLLGSDAAEPTPSDAAAGKAERAAALARLHAGLDFVVSDSVEFFVAERERRLLELGRAEMRFRDLVQLSPDAIIVCRNNRIEFVNPAAVELFGANVADDLVGKSPQDVFHPDGHGLIRECLNRLLKGERHHDRVEQRVVRFDGGVRDVEMSSARFEDERGTALQVILRDITDRKRVEQTLREREAELRLAQGIAHVGSWSWTVGTEILEASEEVFHIYGLDPRLPPPPNDSEALRLHYTPEGWKRRQAAFKKALTDGLPWQREEQIIRPDGSVRWVHFRGAAQRDVSGRIVKLRGTIQDITERKLAEQALARSEAVLAEAGRMAHVGAWWIDVSNAEQLQSNPLRWSDEVYRIFGYEPGEVEVTNALFFEHVHPADRRRVADTLAQAITSRRMDEVEHRIVRRDRTERIVLEHGTMHVDSAGGLVAIVGAVQDITEQKRAEQALRDADRRKDEFLGMLSHELRNPLAPIWNSIYILNHSDPTGEQARHAREVIARQAGHLGRLVDDLLDVTRIARGKIELRRSRVDLNEIVRRTGEDHRSLLDENGIELVFDLPRTSCWVEGDLTRLAQIVGNLLQNSAKFTPSGGQVMLTVCPRQHTAEVHVRDTGSGIDPSLLDRIFEPFTQGAQNLARSTGGLGLGLALVKGLTELHGGSVEARSGGPGQGAEFIVRFPLAVPAVPEQAHPAPSNGPAAGGRRVLVVDDNRDAAESLAELVQLLGHRAEVAFDGPSAIERVRASPPDIVLCDIGLPGMSGYDVARTIRSEQRLVGVHLVAITGYAHSEDRQRALEAGFADHVVKPPSPGEIERLLI